MSIPIIFTHTNNSLYLQLALLRAKKSCKENVCLIGDNSNAASFVRHFNLSDYDKSSLCLEFEKHYKHYSPNPYNYEFFCYKRWFVALDFLQKNNLSECFCVDSDVLIYDDLNKLSGLLADKDFSVIYQSADRFCDTLANAQFHNDDSYDDDAELMQMYEDVDLLIIDGEGSIVILIVRYVDNLIGKWPLVMCLGLMVVEWIQRDKQHVLQLSGKFFAKRWVRWILYVSIAMYALLVPCSQQDFIYFQF